MSRVPDQRCVPEWPAPDPMTHAWAMQAAYRVARSDLERAAVVLAGEMVWPHPCSGGTVSK